MYHSLSEAKVRVDEVYDFTLGSSLFDYANVREEGVLNRLWTLSPAITSPPQCFEDFVAPAFPLIQDDILVANNAIYGGTTHDAVAGQVELVSLRHIPYSICAGTGSKYCEGLADRLWDSGISFIRAPFLSPCFWTRNMWCRVTISSDLKHELGP